MRYFIELAYNGTRFSGWQRQPNDRSVQETIEVALTTLLRQPISIMGCGRTDAGVHASQFFLHFDFEEILAPNLIGRLNKFLGKDIAIRRIFPVAAEAHARFDATARSYAYHLCFEKDPFRQESCYAYLYAKKPDFQLVQAAAQLLLSYDAFFPFCKTNSDAKTMNCQLTKATWEIHPETETWIFHISANRFLRGMVRLIVGMCLQVGTGKIALAEVKAALDEQRRLSKSLSVPPEGLFLTKVVYPFL